MTLNEIVEISHWGYTHRGSNKISTSNVVTSPHLWRQPSGKRSDWLKGRLSEIDQSEVSSFTLLVQYLIKVWGGGCVTDQELIDWTVLHPQGGEFYLSYYLLFSCTVAL